MYTNSYKSSVRIKAWLLLNIMIAQLIVPPSWLYANVITNDESIRAHDMNINMLSPSCETSIDNLQNHHQTKKDYNESKFFEESISDHGGPSMPEVQRFTPAGANDLVNLFTGDLNYNLPLLDVGGYPVNISYNSNVGPNDEASWVGLGWTLNVGAIERSVRGLPDDFNGDVIKKKAHMKTKEVISAGGGFDIQISGVKISEGVEAGGEIGLSTEFEYDTYEGHALKLGVNGGFDFGSDVFGGGLGLAAGISSNGGGYLNPNLSLSGKFSQSKTNTTIGAGVNLDINSREGLKAINFGIFSSLSVQRTSRHSSHNHPTQIAGINKSYPLNFVAPSYSPSFEMPMNNSAYALKINLGGEVGTIHLNGEMTGSFSSQAMDTSRTLKSYGYLYLQYSNNDALLDFNREKDGTYFHESPNLPLTATTFDVFNISAQGLNGNFRAFRGDIGMIHDPSLRNSINNISLGAEVGGGNLIHVGANLGTEMGAEETKKWEDGNQLTQAFRFQDTSNIIPEYEPVYFKMLGEKNVIMNQGLFDSLGGFEPIQANLFRENDISSGNVSDHLSNGIQYSNHRQTRKSVREKRNTLISWKTNSELLHSSQLRNHYRNDLSVRSTNFPGPQNRSSHIGEFTVTSPNGMIYIYAQPAYNNFIKERSFNVGHSHEEHGNVDYDETMNSPRNEIGNQFFLEERTPSYAYAWLLTGIVSNDYQDLTHDGITADDIGSYTRFSYLKTHGNFLWRTPVESGKAKFQEGYYHSHEDNKGQYVFGGKEIFYLDSIITRNYVAKFYSSPRYDALGVGSENGGIDPNQTLKKLDSIQLFTFHETAGTPKIPIKTVHFEYDYSLCHNVPNTINPINPADNGKLTLKKIWFTFHKSKKQKESPYKFHYQNNKNYDSEAVDRWGVYKPNQEGEFNNDRFPYVNEENKLNQDEYASSWLLNEIDVPMGGRLHIDYESDDYAYVQNKPVMTMMKVKGISSNTSSISSNSILYTGQTISTVSRYLFFELPEELYTRHDSSELFRYFDGIRELYFNVMLKIIDNHEEELNYDAVSGFIPIHFSQNDFNSKFGFGPVHSGWIRLPLILKDNDAEYNNQLEYTFAEDPVESATVRHPFTQSGIEFLMGTLPLLINGNKYEGTMSDPIGALNELAESFEEVFHQGPEPYLMMRNRCNKIRAEGSFIRLNHPTGFKAGGGSRVRKIYLDDNWKHLQVPGVNNLVSHQYGVEYKYTHEGKSSGVASYEPMIGNDENPFVLPVRYRIAKPLAADVNKWQIEPIGEIFFPGPVVGYTVVKQSSLQHDQIKKHATGYSITEFYTSKDFPTQTRNTRISLLPKNVIVPLFVFNLKEQSSAVSQGFAIECNNMHGVLKSQKTFDANDVLLESSEYHYQLTETGELDNNVLLVNPATGKIENKTIGVDYDLTVDARNFFTWMFGFDFQFNLDLIGPTPPIPVIVPIPTTARNSTEYRGITFTKVIYKCGILKSIENNKMGSQFTTEYKLYDGNTGEPIATRLDNEFGTSYYSVGIPAYWNYPQMGFASENDRIAKVLTIRSGSAQCMNANQYFKPGDELSLRLVDSDVLDLRAWVFKIVGNTLHFITGTGENNIPNGNYLVHINRSGNRNQLDAQSFHFIHVDSLISTIRGERYLNMNASRILSATAQTYSDYWQTDLPVRVTENNADCECNQMATSYFKQTSFPALQIFSAVMQRFPAMNRDSLRRSGVEYFPNRIIIHHGDCTYTLSTINGAPFLFPVISSRFEVPTHADFQCQNLDYVYVVNVIGNSTQTLILQTDCADLVQCKAKTESHVADCGFTNGHINPYLNGIFGNYKPITSYVPLSKRTVDDQIKNAGFIESYQPFWNWNASGLTQNAAAMNWVRKDSVAVANSNGQILETIDAINNSSSSNFSFGRLITEVAGIDLHYHEMAYDGFEDYDFNYKRLSSHATCFFPDYFKLNDEETDIVLKAEVDYSVSHSGQASLKVDKADQAEYIYSVMNAPITRAPRHQRFTESIFNLTPGDLIFPFTPMPGKQILSAWVHNPSNSSALLSTSVEILINGVSYYPSGPIIDGWQQIYAEFVIPSSATTFKLQLKNNGLQSVWFDDIRIHPFRSNINTFSYNAALLRLDAKHDELNYTSFYEYDHEGNLSRTKRETEVGIMTIQEVKTELPKLNR